MAGYLRIALLALPLLVARVRADDAHDSATSDDFAVLADATDACSDLHDNSRWLGVDGWFESSLTCG